MSDLSNDYIGPADLEAARSLIAGWVQNRRDADWMRRNLSDDFRFSTFLMQRVLGKDEFIEIVSNTPAELEVVSVAAEAVGKIIVTRLLLDVIEEDFTSEPDDDLPSGEDMADKIVGHRIVYTSGLRRAGGGWQCFDHHQIGAVD